MRRWISKGCLQRDQCKAPEPSRKDQAQQQAGHVYGTRETCPEPSRKDQAQRQAGHVYGTRKTCPEPSRIEIFLFFPRVCDSLSTRPFLFWAWGFLFQGQALDSMPVRHVLKNSNIRNIQVLSYPISSQIFKFFIPSVFRIKNPLLEIKNPTLKLKSLAPK